MLTDLSAIQHLFNDNNFICSDSYLQLNFWLHYSIILANCNCGAIDICLQRCHLFHEVILVKNCNFTLAEGYFTRCVLDCCFGVCCFCLQLLLVPHQRGEFYICLCLRASLWQFFKATETSRMNGICETKTKMLRKTPLCSSFPPIKRPVWGNFTSCPHAEAVAYEPVHRSPPFPHHHSASGSPSEMWAQFLCIGDFHEFHAGNYDRRRPPQRLGIVRQQCCRNIKIWKFT